jgi:excinuclease ABC subunit C
LTAQQSPDDLPNKPGVYIMKDSEDRILYVGKAKSLKKRVKSYFKDEIDYPKTRAMMKQFHSLEYLVTDTEKEALILESNLIKKHLPRYNIRLKDDKRYPYIKITNEDYPRILITRRVFDDGSYYYGPFTDVKALRKMLKFLKSIFKIRECKKMDGPCLNYQIQLCEAPCKGKISKNDYQKLVHRANLFFEGKYAEIIAIMKDMMVEASKNQEYEKAGVIRDQINSVKEIVEKQKMEFNRNLEQDVIACSLDEEIASVVVFSVRDGKIMGKDDFLMSGAENTSPEKILSAFLKQYYTGPRTVPAEIILQNHVEDEDLIVQWLSDKLEGKITINVPKEGMEYRLVRMVAKNADIIRHHQKQVKGALVDLKKYLGIPKLPRHIEAFDISNISGKMAVGSLVVFEDGVPQKKNYRRYKIKTPGPDDYAMMREVLERRYKKLAEQENYKTRVEQENYKNLAEEKSGSRSEGPDLIVVDGGKGQLNVALDVLKTFGITDIPVIGLAKEFEHVFIPGVSSPIILPSKSEALHLLQRIRDEAHRFALSYHKKLRSKDLEGSVLDQIPGVGPKRKLKLMRHFGHLQEIKKASVEDISEVKGISPKLAREIHQYLQEEEEK